MKTAACLDCVLKHLSQAMIIHEEEVPLGYPGHILRVIGHMAEASRESVAEFSQLANVIRDYRLCVMDDSTYTVPFQGILEYVLLLRHCIAKGLDKPAIPEELYCKAVPGDTIGPFQAP